ncbi:glycosyltransferase family 4 protein [Marinisporobacter balticus]|uniref:Spore coat protein SA n=1 Tax=Marinisporobacter balticus TaxID=2018667 RepID=A0A4R2KBY7_9FIRM|nr:glycosyltransferase family 4 protein [Marinisporobacter balticus]TCO71031.1 spore coat protein SA [Marinisporobacter balticus]
MKIALICTEKLPVPPILGGAIQIYIDALLPILSKYHEITLFSLHNSKLKNKEKKGKVRYIRVSGKTGDQYINNIKKEISKEKFDLIHVFNRPLWVLRINDVAEGRPISLSLHNEMFAPKKIDQERGIKCIERVSFISTVSKFIADDVVNMYPCAKDKIYPVYSAVDLNTLKPFWHEDVKQDREDMKKKYGLENHKVIINVGRLSKKKGTHIVLKAMEKVMNHYPNTALILVGSKWYGSNATDIYVKKVQEFSKKLKGPVIFTGFLPPAEIPKYYNIGDIFICASQWTEPLARVHYEAMAAGLPIITTDRGGNAEVIEENVNGIAIKEYDNPDVMEEKIVHLLENEDVALNMGKMGRKFAEERYHWKRVADDLLRLFESI